MVEKGALDPVALDPDKFEVRFENERVRVLEVRMVPGTKHAMHWHPPAPDLRPQLLYGQGHPHPTAPQRWDRDERARSSGGTSYPTPPRLSVTPFFTP